MCIRDRLEAGALYQRPLWASTGTKNPAYSETMYVDNLVAPHTVNTMPMKTLLAVAERGQIDPGSADRDAGPALAALAQAGIDMSDVTKTLLEQGIAAFVTPMNKLLAGIESARQAVLTGRPEAIAASIPVSYTHLDVYKRQAVGRDAAGEFDELVGALEHGVGDRQPAEAVPAVP